VGFQPLVHMMKDRDILDVIERPAIQKLVVAEGLLHELVALLGQMNLAGLLVEIEMDLLEPGDERVDGDVEIGMILGRTRDDERRAGLVDQDRIHLVHDGEAVARCTMASRLYFMLSRR